MGKVEKVTGGYRLSGRWSFSSGCDHCQWVNPGAIPGTVKVEGREVPDEKALKSGEGLAIVTAKFDLSKGEVTQ
jgi:3-hydroxy-9,10-secoandrosta-1,3,5(10)-triene-9,17-dione monooxygenase